MAVILFKDHTHTTLLMQNYAEIDHPRSSHLVEGRYTSRGTETNSANINRKKIQNANHDRPIHEHKFQNGIQKIITTMDA